MKRLSLAIALIGLFAGGCGGSSQQADLVFRSGYIYTVNPAQPFAEAVAIKDGRFVAVGYNAEIDEWIGSKTQVVELDILNQHMVLPGIIDLHVHPFTTALFNILNLNFSDNKSHGTMMADLKAFAEEHVQNKWIRGGSWGIGVYPDNNPHKSEIDAVVSDRPVILIDETGHSYWLNSKALELAGITRDRPDGPGEIIERDESGDPTGVVREAALRLVERVAEQPSLEDWVAVEKKVMAEFSRNGITAMQTAEGSNAHLDAFVAMEEAGELPMRVFVAWDWHFAQVSPLTNEEMDAQIEGRAKYETERIKPNYVKIFADGTPVGYKSLFVEEYSNKPGEFGNANMTAEQFNEAIAAFDAAGLGCFIHTIGDGTTRRVLDALEYTRATNGSPGTRHKLSHLMWIHQDDIPRFGEIPNIAADFSPGLLYNQPGVYESVTDLLGKGRVARTSPVRHLVAQDIPVGYGSDWLTVAPVNPWPQMQSFMWRRNPGHPRLPAQNPSAAVTIEHAIQIFTFNGARAVDAASSLGTIEVGKYADMVVIDRNLLQTPLTKIRETQVLKTISGGQIVYDAAH